MKPHFVHFNDLEVRRGKDQVTQVSCGAVHSLSLTQSGRLFAWGDNKQAQLGLGHFNREMFPKAVSSMASLVCNTFKNNQGHYCQDCCMHCGSDTAYTLEY